MSDSTETPETQTEQQGFKENLLSKLDLLKNGCGCLLLGAAIALSTSAVLLFVAPYRVECREAGSQDASAQKFGDLASADAYYARQIAAGKTCTKDYPSKGN